MTRWGVVGAVLASAAMATTLLAMDVPMLTRESDLVVRGVVVRSQARWTKDQRRIMTDTEVQVSEVLKGNATEKTLVVMQPGGAVGDVGQMVHGVATFTPGDEVVLFLERRGDRTFVVGLAQGRLVVDRSGSEPMVRGGEEELMLLDAKTHQPVPSPIQPMSLSKLRDLIRTAVGTVPATTPTPTKPGVLVP